MDSNLQLRLATRIHFALLRRYGENVPIADLLTGTGEAQDALWVCEASGDPELCTLAARLAAGSAGATEAAALDSMWATSTTGFGVTGGTQFGELVAVPPAAATVRGGAAR